MLIQLTFFKILAAENRPFSTPKTAVKSEAIAVVPGEP
jgi:hypothetical protein